MRSHEDDERQQFNLALVAIIAVLLGCLLFLALGC